MTPLEAMREALHEIPYYAGDQARLLIEALNRRNIVLVAVDPEIAPRFIQTRDSGK